MRISILTTARAAAAGALVVTGAAAAQAQDWSGQVTLYGWGSGISGDFTPFTGAPTLSFDKSLSEVLEDLDGAFFANVVVRNGDLVLLGDFTYSASSRDGLVPPGIPASGEVTMQSLTLAAGKRFDLGGGTTIDALGGLRAWSLEGEISVPAVGVSVTPGTDFVDPIVAVRVHTPISDRWSIMTYADVGGFGVGSELTWQAAVTANYQASDNVYISAGWRHLAVDYSDNGTVFDGAMSGPLIGATFTF